MSKINQIQKKSVVYCNAGNGLNTISIIILIAGIILSIIIFVNSEIEDAIIPGIGVFVTSVFLCVFCKAVAKIANYAQAIYKNTNQDFDFDKYLEKGLKFLPGDKAMAKEKGVDIPLTIKSLSNDSSGNIVYKCETEGNELKDYLGSQLTRVE